MDDVKSVLDQTDRLVAAIFAAATCAGLKSHKVEDYLSHYDSFLNRIYERELAAAEARLEAIATQPDVDF